ncbi:MAG: ribosomal RNA small subunit methyltransferase A [Chloroflexi bacterium]|nr:ribosomal RNA small subunit methyltransferase A [Chloroflexota bacterium]
MYQQTLRQFGFKPKKRLGQHFLIDEAVLERILSAAQLSPGDVVVEIGPGLGILTEGLAKRGARVIAVELDSKLVALLKKRLAAFPDVRIIHADILKVTPRQLLENNLPASELARGYKVIANLPYYITSPVLGHFLEAQPRPSEMVIMVQKEVGETIAAVPGKMRLLSVKAQFYGKPTIIAYVPATSFYPPPKVDSVILQLDVYSQPPIEISDVVGFFNIVMHGFSAPRKQLRNSLAHSLEMPPNQVALLLEKAGIDGKRRAETLSLEEWRELWKVFAPYTCHPEPFTSCHSERSEESSPAQGRLRGGSRDSSSSRRIGTPQNDIGGE